MFSVSLFYHSRSLPLPSSYSYSSSFSVSSREVCALEELTPTTGYSTSVPEGSGILAFIAPWIGYHASNRLKEVNSSQTKLCCRSLLATVLCPPHLTSHCYSPTSPDLPLSPGTWLRITRRAPGNKCTPLYLYLSALLCCGQTGFVFTLQEPIHPPPPNL